MMVGEGGLLEGNDSEGESVSEWPTVLGWSCCSEVQSADAEQMQGRPRVRIRPVAGRHGWQRETETSRGVLGCSFPGSDSLGWTWTTGIGAMLPPYFTE